MMLPTTNSKFRSLSKNYHSTISYYLGLDGKLPVAMLSHCTWQGLCNVIYLIYKYLIFNWLICMSRFPSRDENTDKVMIQTVQWSDTLYKCKYICTPAMATLKMANDIITDSGLLRRVRNIWRYVKHYTDMTCCYTACCFLATSNFAVIRSIKIGLAQFVVLFSISVDCGAGGFSIYN